MPLYAVTADACCQFTKASTCSAPAVQSSRQEAMKLSICASLDPMNANVLFLVGCLGQKALQRNAFVSRGTVVRPTALFCRVGCTICESMLVQVLR